MASSANGLDADRDRASLPTSVTRAPISLARSVRRAAKARRSHCPSLTHSPCSFTSMRYRATSPRAHTPFCYSIEPDGIRPASSACLQTSRRSYCLRARRSSTRSRISGSICAQTGFPIASSKPTTRSSTQPAKPGENSSLNRKQSHQSGCATGQTSVSPYDRRYHLIHRPARDIIPPLGGARMFSYSL